MALKPDDQQHRDNLVTAAQVLRDTDRVDLAESVDYVLSPQGVAFVGRIRVDRLDSDDDRNPNLPVSMPTSRKDQVKRLAKAAGESPTRVVEDYFRRFLDGEWMPEKEPRATRGAGETRAILNVTPDKDLHADVAARCRELKVSQQRTGLFVSTVAAHALYAHYGIGPYGSESSGTE
ncbi:hypothetical protein HY68_36805 [Streptomyces sp. AcH 505]|uniref:hypothetical protein n=1 Tax=Streptomyces sp. AcH 505 TaxID=352211 RepID=UPI000591DFF9|nr:hypothetical protein HY68_36805 [Streptomyces sp. AcH 505]